LEVTAAQPVLAGIIADVTIVSNCHEKYGTPVPLEEVHEMLPPAGSEVAETPCEVSGLTVIACG